MQIRPSRVKLSAEAKGHGRLPPPSHSHVRATAGKNQVPGEPVPTLSTAAQELLLPNDLLIGGTGNDFLTTGAGADLIAFNKGDGQDTVAISTTQDNTLALGGGAVYADLLFQKSGNNLILKVGATDQITFTGYYTSAANRSVDKLQVVIEGTSDYALGPGDRRVDRICVEMRSIWE